jgi:large subunit ribosomal protein L18
MRAQKLTNVKRLRRVHRVRKRLRGSAERPRLSVCRSNKHVSCQIIDDEAGRTLVSASTLDKSLREQVGGKSGNRAAAKLIGGAIAQRALAAGITQVTFDRGRYKYHGRVAELAGAAREGGLVF